MLWTAKNSRNFFLRFTTLLEFDPNVWNLSLYREVKYHLAYICHKCSDQFQRKQQTYEWTNFSHFGYILWKIYPNAILKYDFFDK